MRQITADANVIRNVVNNIIKITLKQMLLILNSDPVNTHELNKGVALILVTHVQKIKIRTMLG